MRPLRSALTFGWIRHHIRRELHTLAPTNPGMSARSHQSKGGQNDTSVLGIKHSCKLNHVGDAVP